MKLLLISILATMILLTGCADKYTVNNMKLVKFESEDEIITYDIGIFQNSSGETFKFYLSNSDFKLMTIGQLYNVTYYKDGNSLDSRDYTVKSVVPSNLDQVE